MNQELETFFVKNQVHLFQIKTIYRLLVNLDEPIRF